MGYMIRKHFLLPQTTTIHDTIMAKKKGGRAISFDRFAVSQTFLRLCHRPIEKISHTTTYAEICVSAETYFDVWAADFLAETGSLYDGTVLPSISETWEKGKKKMGNNIFLRIIVPCVLCAVCCCCWCIGPSKLFSHPCRRSVAGAETPSEKEIKKEKWRTTSRGRSLGWKSQQQHSMQKSKKNLKQTLSTTPKYTQPHIMWENRQSPGNIVVVVRLLLLL
jgi:hypothetical protein